MAEITVKQAELPAINASLAQLAQMDLPVSGALSVRRLARAVAPLNEDFQMVKRALIEKYARRDDAGEIEVDGGNIRIDLSRAEDANRDFAELDSATVALDAAPLTAADFGDGKIKAEILIGLGDLLED